jgi:cephalosporin hydroxylase
MSESKDINAPENNVEFSKERNTWRIKMAESAELRKKAIELTLMSNKFKYGYQFEWCGVPIIRHPDDIVLQQEIVWSLRPTHIIETGVARGGSLVLSSTLMKLYEKSGKVLGLDIKIYDHTIENLVSWMINDQIKIFECDSASKTAEFHVQDFLKDNKQPVLVVLDSNHTENHVLNELNCFAPLLPVGSIIIVADTIIEEMPKDYYSDRAWNVGNNPLTAVDKFLELNNNFIKDLSWSRRSLMGECRDGIICKISN